jgi:diguanylate cyclase (GGDEF)-like protein
VTLQFLESDARYTRSDDGTPDTVSLHLVDRRRPAWAAYRRRVAEMTVEEMRAELLTDTLTGLGNARALKETKRGAGILVVDVVRFKEINDTYGHENADRVLQAIGRHLGDIAGSGRAFRPYGDKFVGDFDSTEAARQAAEVLTARVARTAVSVEMPSGRQMISGLRIHTGVGQTTIDAGHDLNRRAGGAAARRRGPKRHASPGRRLLRLIAGRSFAADRAPHATIH